MRDESIALLKELCETGGPSGYEQPVQAIVRREAARYADRVTTDVMGSVIAARNPDGRPRLMFAGHADEIGFLVRYVNDEGYIYFGPVGGWDPEIVVGQRVTIHTEGGPVRGVIGKRAIHLMDEEDRKKRSELHTLWIDVGLTSRAAVEERVSIGDPITMAAGFERLQDDVA